MFSTLSGAVIRSFVAIALVAATAGPTIRSNDGDAAVTDKAATDQAAPLIVAQGRCFNGRCF
jgi:hypothetical protein